MKKLNILLISVLMEKNAIITEEIGMCSIASYLESQGHTVNIINSSRNYLDYDKIYKLQPDLIGFPVYSTTETLIDYVCKKIKKRLPDVKICYGGYWPTLSYQYLMERYPHIDYIILGEGELVFEHLATALEKNDDLANVKGLVYRNHITGAILANEREELIANLDDLPFPKRDLLDNNLLKYAYISTSRGCVANCSFCWHQKFWNTDKKNIWRGRTPDNIVKEVKELVTKYNIDRFWFIDDSFEDHNNTCPNRMWEIAEKIIDSNIHISYETYMRAEVHRKLDDSKMKLLTDSGFVGVIFGIESGNAQDLKLYRKIATVEDNYLAVEFFRKHGIAVDIGFINFNPYSTIDHLFENVNYLEKTCFASVLYYLVERCGITEFSHLFNKVKEDGLLIEDSVTKCHSYRYVNENIGELSKYLYFKYHENENSKEYFYAKKIGSYIREEFKLLNHIKRKYSDRSSIISKIEKSEDRAWEILYTVNQSNAACFRELLELTDKGWDISRAEKITENYLNLTYLKGKSDLLEKNRLGLYLELKKNGISPQEYFNFS